MWGLFFCHLEFLVPQFLWRRAVETTIKLVKEEVQSSQTLVVLHLLARDLEVQSTPTTLCCTACALGPCQCVNDGGNFLSLWCFPVVGEEAVVRAYKVTSHR
jgi:hypothetical protein